jgi:ABC-type transporter Mla MlaB component
MKARPKKPSARSTAARKSAATGKRAAVARKAKVTAKPAKAPKPAKAAKPDKAAKAAAGKPSRAALGADCTIEHAPGLQQQLAKVLTDRACVTLDFSAVKRCDTAGMQVLAAFIRERREAGRDIELASMSENFLATVKLLGLSALFAPVAEVSA